MKIINNKTEKKKHLVLLISGILLISMALAGGCGGDDDDDSTPGPTLPTSDGTNTYKDQELVPSGLEIIDLSGDTSPCSISESDLDIECLTDCSTNSPGDPTCILNCYSEGLSSGSFQIYIEIENNSGADATVTIPAGTAFFPSDGSYQPMMTIEDILIDIPDSDTEGVCIPVFCLAAELHAPDEDADYSDDIDLVTGGCLADILAYLEDVDIQSLDFNTIMQIQNIIWDCTDPDTDVSQEDWAWLQSL